MGVEKYFAGLFMMLICLIAFSSLYYDSLTASAKTTNNPYVAALNNTNQYASGLANQTEDARNKVLTSGVGATQTDPLALLRFAGQSVAIAVTALFSSLGIFFSLSGIMSTMLPVAAIFIGLGISWVVLMFVLSTLKAIRLGDTSG